MEQLLIGLLNDCNAYLSTYKALVKSGKTPTENQKKQATALNNLMPLLTKAQGKSKTEDKAQVNPVMEFNDLYNKNFDYLDKFTSVPQRNLQCIFQYQQLVEKMAKLYTGIPEKTITRQGKMLSSRKKAVDKWLSAFQGILQGSEIQAALEERFKELLAKANTALTEKGLATISIASDNSHA